MKSKYYKFSDIINLINNAEEGDTIKLSGYYIGNGKSININKMITIIGDNNTILDANGSSGIFEIYSSNVIIQNLKLVNGTGSCSPKRDGCIITLYCTNQGTIYWVGDNGLLSNCIIENNYDEYTSNRYGRGIFWDASNGKIINCTFKNNLISDYGGAIYVNGNGIKISNCLFENNYVIENFMRRQGGGAIYTDGENHIIENCTFIGNSALKSWGGAIKRGSGSISVNFNIFINNSALLGNHISSINFEYVNNNIFYMNSISDINSCAEEVDIIKLFDNNTFIVNGNIITKDYYLLILYSN